MPRSLCVEWRERGETYWNYVTGSRGKSRGELARLLAGWEARNPLFEFRIREWTPVSA